MDHHYRIQLSVYLEHLVQVSDLITSSLRPCPCCNGIVIFKNITFATWTMEKASWIKMVGSQGIAAVFILGLAGAISPPNDDDLGLMVSTSGESGPWEDPFLPSYQSPLRYDLWLYPDFYHDGSAFFGKENITIAVNESTHYLIVHINYLEITMTRVSLSASGQDLALVRAFSYSRNQYWVVETVEEITTNTDVILYLEFTGSLVNGIVGYYKSNYTNSLTGERSWLATSKFQPSDARKAFPNFDEPRYKSRFTITLKHWHNFTALSNMPVQRTVILDPTFRETTFEQTPIMSSYLICFIVNDFIYLENTLNSGQMHRVWATPDKINQTLYALETGLQVANFLQVEFTMPFQLPKLDEFAVPDYPSGATEHWGLVTYRETRLLYDETMAGDYDKQRVAQIIAHEHAHHYFGDYITCVWWDEIWLNEAFASFYEHRALIQNNPDWQMMEQFVVRVQQPVMTTDGGASSRPVVVPVTNPAEATAAFDGITYDKGASMLRMLETIMGAQNFLNGLRTLLQTHAYGSVNTQDLWRSLQLEYSGVNIATVMDPWVYQMGLPIINITERPGPTLLAEQSRFMTDPSSNLTQPPSPYGYKWYVPLTYKTEGGAIGLYWLNATNLEFADPRGTNSQQWIKFNNDLTGFYRVNLPLRLWTLLGNQLRADHSVFTSIDRAQLVDDALNIARAAQLDYDVALSMTTYLVREKEFAPWKSSEIALGYISTMMYSDANYGLWREYVQNITEIIMDELQVQDGGSHMHKLNRNTIISLACGHGNLACLRNTTLSFLQWIENEIANPVPQNIRRVVYGFGIQTAAGDNEWNEGWNRYERATSGQEKDNLMYALAQTPKLWLIQRYLDYSMDETKIRTQDFFTVINYLAANKAANRYVWDWVRATYDELLQRFSINDRYFGRMVPSIVTNYNTEFQLEEVIAFYAKYPEAGAGQRPREQSLDSIRANIAWMARNKETIVNWLQSN